MKTQTERLLHALRQQAYTYGGLEALKVSTCPWRRLTGVELARHLREGERLVRSKNTAGLVTLRVVRIAR